MIPLDLLFRLSCEERAALLGLLLEDPRSSQRMRITMNLGSVHSRK